MKKADALARLEEYHHGSLTVEGAHELAEALGLPLEKVPVTELKHEPKSGQWLHPQQDGNVPEDKVNAWACKVCGSVWRGHAHYQLKKVEFCPHCGDKGKVNAIYIYEEGESIKGVVGLYLSSAIVTHLGLASTVPQSMGRGTQHRDNVDAIRKYWKAEMS
jgi:predicted RNA-binding Zn-ribbon protein involved in translation (DUF1610 family)